MANNFKGLHFCHIWIWYFEVLKRFCCCYIFLFTIDKVHVKCKICLPSWSVLKSRKSLYSFLASAVCVGFLFAGKLPKPFIMWCVQWHVTAHILSLGGCMLFRCIIFWLKLSSLLHDHLNTVLQTTKIIDGGALKTLSTSLITSNGSRKQTCEHYLPCIFRLTPPSRLNKAGPSINKSFSNFNKIWFVDRSWWVILWCYATWPDPRSKSWSSKSCDNGRFQRLSPLPICM